MDTFRADTVRFVGREDLERDDRDDAFDDDDEESDDDEETDAEDDEYVAVLVEGTVYRPLDASGVLVVRDTAGRNHRILVEDDFIVRTRTGHTTADKLEKGGKVAVKAYRDDDRNLIAQTIRLR